jgi:hypothetical protein
MKYIINTFDKDLIYKVAYKLNGQIISEDETLVLVNSDDECILHQKLEKILEGDFRITENDEKGYNPDLETKVNNLINWGELSRILSGSRSVVSNNRTPKKHIDNVQSLKWQLEDWVNSLRS